MSGRVRALALTAMTIVISLVGAVVSATPASAAPGSDLMSELTSEKWSDEMRWAVMGTDEFTAAFTQDGCTSPNMGHFTQSWILNSPAIMGELQTRTGEIVLPQFAGLTNGKAPVQNWDATSSIPYVSNPLTGLTWSLGEPLQYRDPANPWREMPAGTWPCFETMSQFTKGVSENGGVSWFNSPNAAMPWPDTVNGSGAAADSAVAPSAFWWKYSGGAKPRVHQEDGDDFKVSDGKFCDPDGLNPLCMTATFMQCPLASEGTLPGGNAAEQAAALPESQWARKAATMNCLIWNHNVLLYNAWLKYHLINSASVEGNASPNWDYAQLILSAKKFEDAQDTVVVMAWVAAAVGVAAGVLISGGSLIMAILGVSALLITAAGAWDEVWGTVVCSSELGKCMGRLAAEGLAFGADMVASTANSVQAPQLDNSSGVFNTLAAVSFYVMLILLLLGLAWAIFTAKFGQLLPLSFGLARWGVGIGLGSTLLTIAFSLSDMVSNAIAGAGGTGRQLNQFAGSIAEASMNMGLIEGFVGWVFFIIAAIVGMVASAIVWIVLNVSYGFIGLAVALMILQLAGATGFPGIQKWITRGWGLFWTILMLKPAITLVSVMVPLSGGDDPFRTILVGIALLVVAALAPMLIVSMFPVMGAGGLGVMSALANTRQAGGLVGGAGKAAAAGASMIAGLSRGEGVKSFLSAIRGGSDGGGSGSKGSAESKSGSSTSGKGTQPQGSGDGSKIGAGKGQSASGAPGGDDASTNGPGAAPLGQGDTGREAGGGGKDSAPGPDDLGLPSRSDAAATAPGAGSGGEPAGSASELAQSALQPGRPGGADSQSGAAQAGSNGGRQVPGTPGGGQGRSGAQPAGTDQSGKPQGPAGRSPSPGGSGSAGQVPGGSQQAPGGAGSPRTAARDAAAPPMMPAGSGPAFRSPQSPAIGPRDGGPLPPVETPGFAPPMPADDGRQSGSDNGPPWTPRSQGAPQPPWSSSSAPDASDGLERVVPRWVSSVADLDSRDGNTRDEV